MSNRLLDLMAKLQKSTDNWQIKKVLKPYYLPALNQIKKRFINKNFNKHGNQVLKETLLVFEEIGLPYWVEFGTLLGIIREGDLIRHDLDLDFGMFFTDRSKKIKETFEKHGFHRTHVFFVEGDEGLEEGYEKYGVKVDIFYFIKTNKGMHCHLFLKGEDNNLPVREIRTSVNTIRELNWKNFQIGIPSDPDKRLRDTYGDYTIPNSKWDTLRDAKNSEIILATGRKGEPNSDC